QMAYVGEQLLGALVRRAVGQLGQNLRFGQVRCGDGGDGEQSLAHGEADFVAAQRAAAAGTQYRVADQRYAGQLAHDVEHGVDHLDRAEHAQLDGGDRQVGDHRVGLGHDPVAVEHAEIGNIDG